MQFSQKTRVLSFHTSTPLMMMSLMISLMSRFFVSNSPSLTLKR